MAGSASTAMPLPPAEQLHTSSSLLHATSTLFEPSHPLNDHLVPSLAALLPFQTYDALITACDRITATWTEELRAQFIAAHPRIGEVNNLSALSAQEQASKRTPPEVLVHLESLNAQYEQTFPGLRFITFVAGRSREQVALDLEAFLQQHPTVHEPGTAVWSQELNRAIADIWAIARHRVKGMGLA